jgi:hypothetical protein
VHVVLDSFIEDALFLSAAAPGKLLAQKHLVVIPAFYAGLKEHLSARLALKYLYVQLFKIHINNPL